ncbi:hypothetical protein K466DRAFT_488780 [Polyporus arcularius HHB13444]|uniref:BTB domain-containing protein n=1 Tax=Polyporus arcularius HHB13444 TaxID=1314778 RepID=A0A5C3PJX4_9APHY|nr:hypothetical protein K466DRAFT_488780 [Polyporus arcularius HHB13444]
MTSPPTSPTRPSPGDLQSHLYASFLQRKTTDVALRVSGSWHAVYKLHRVILIQAGFFQSLFTSGFSESASQYSSHRVGPNHIEIVLDDPNITRAGEICIARLYGGGPPLWISPSLIPTPSHPLTPAFASTGYVSSSSQSANLFPSSLDISSAPDQPSGHHPATPRFLLSLLATAVFLSIPSVTSQALAAIVRTVGPHTVTRYLNFAIGRGIGPVYDVGTGNEDIDHESEAAVGLEEVAELVGEEDVSASYDSTGVPAELVQRPKHDRGFSAGRSGTLIREVPNLKHSHCRDETPDSDSEPETDPDAQQQAEDIRSSHSKADCQVPCYYYGAISDKVGEAASCWLSRWGVDMLRYEERSFVSAPNQDVKGKDVIWSPFPHQVQLVHERPGSAPPDMTGSQSSGKSRLASGKTTMAPVIWRSGGLSARWVRGIISSDAFFIRGEKERYEVARRVVEMRKVARTGDDSGESEEAEQVEFERMFAEGIYYANMHLDDLMAISRDVSPSTGKPVVPLAVLQAALWNQSSLYHRITYRPPGSSSPSLTSTNATKELGIGLPAGDIGKLALHPEERLKAFYPVPGDSSLRLGDSTGLEGASMDQLFEPVSVKRGTARAVEANFFGLEQSCRPASAFSAPESAEDPLSLSSPLEPATKWTAHPPFRFAVEFWDVDGLKEKSRLHSHTIWYAGSLYNVYVQVVRKKGIQLGIYLHRQSTVDPIPLSSVPVPEILPPPPRDRSVLGRGASSSVSNPRPPSAAGGASTPMVSPSVSSTPLSPFARTGSFGIPGTPTTISSSLPGTPAFASRSSTSTSTTLHSPSGSVGSIAMSSSVSLPATASPVTPQQPYRDPRPQVSAYFTIACASPTGASLTRFTSAPDVFSVSQSWGWKSSSLRTDEYLEVDAEAQPAAVTMPAPKEVSLRATVVLGVV